MSKRSSIGYLKMTVADSAILKFRICLSQKPSYHRHFQCQGKNETKLIPTTVIAEQVEAPSKLSVFGSTTPSTCPPWCSQWQLHRSNTAEKHDLQSALILPAHHQPPLLLLSDTHAYISCTRRLGTRPDNPRAAPGRYMIGATPDCRREG